MERTQALEPKSCEFKSTVCPFAKWQTNPHLSVPQFSALWNNWEVLLASLWWELWEDYRIRAHGSTCMLSTCWISALWTESSYQEFLLTLEVTSIRQSLQLRSRFLECPTWPSSASVFESRVQGVDFWVWMGVKQKLTTSPHKDKPNESKRFPKDHTTI